MRKLPAIALAGTIALALGGAAVAAGRNSHIMTVSLPDGSTARVEYVGDVSPTVTIEPSRFGAFDGWAPVPLFAGLGQMVDQMNRQAQAMVRDMEQVGRQSASGATAPFVASFGNAPAGVTSTTIVSYSNGSSTCTRTTESVSQGPGKPPKVRSTVSGNCGPDADRAQGSSAPSHT